MAQVSFRESAIRHWRDSRTLAAAGEVANVGQLLGFSAECGLKAIYRCFLPQSPDGDIDWFVPSSTEPKRYRKHIDELYSTVSILASSPATAKYSSMLNAIGNFATWSTKQRYWSDAEHLSTCSAYISGWELAAKEVLAMVDEARKDGMAL